MPVSPSAVDAFPIYAIPGVPASGPGRPDKLIVQQWAAALESYILTVTDSANTAIAAVTSGITYDLPRVKPAAFSFVPFDIFRCAAPGLAVHNFDAEVAFDIRYHALTGSTNWGMTDTFQAGDACFDWVNGNDSTGSGDIGNPYKTMTKAAQQSLRTVWALPQTSRETINIDVLNNTGNGGRPLKFKALGGPGTVTFKSPNSMASELTWTASSGLSNVYEATPSGGLLNCVLWYPGGRATGLFIPIPVYANTTALDAVNLGWSQPAGAGSKIYLSISNKNVDSVKGDIELIYLAGANHQIKGLRFFMKDYSFFGTGDLELKHNATPTRTVAYLRNVSAKFSTFKGINSFGSETYYQGCEATLNNADGFGFQAGIDAGTTACQAVLVDCAGWGAGMPLEGAGGNNNAAPTSRNAQGLSGHDNCILMDVNGRYGGGWGQSVANTGSAATYWHVGTKCSDPYYNDATNLFDALEIEGTFWLDTVFAGGAGSDKGMQVQSSTNGHGKIFNCGFHGVNGATNLPVGYSLVAYTPATP